MLNSLNRVSKGNISLLNNITNFTKNKMFFSEKLNINSNNINKYMVILSKNIINIYIKII